MYFIIRLFNHRKKWYYQDLRMIILGNAKRYLFKSSKTLTGLTLLIATALSGIGVMVFVYTISMHTVNSDGPVDFLVSQESYPKLKKVLDEAKGHFLIKLLELNAPCELVKRKRNKKRLKQLMFYPSPIIVTIKKLILIWMIYI